MNPYQSILSSIRNNRLYDWIGFTRDLPSILLEDRNLELLFSKYLFLDDNIDEITIELVDEIYDELAFWELNPPLNIHNESSFYELIYEESTRIFKKVISNYIPSGNQNLTKESEEDSIIPISELIGTNEEEKYLGSLYWDGFQMNDIKNAESDFLNFSFIKIELISKCKNWNYIFKTQAERNIIKVVPVIKTIDYFDPTIYNLIKKNPKLLETMDWRLFEEMLADILRRFKYEVELTKATKDGGIDIIAIKKDENFGLHKYLLQAKRYSSSVQVSPVRELLFLHDEYKATKSCLATTANFTSGAWKLAEKHKWKMELKDQQGILQWIDKVSLT